GVHFPWPRIPEVVRWHHERSDGSGYPDGLLADDVPMHVRIVGLADAFDAMTSDRPYRERLSLGTTLNEIVRLTPQKFDPNAVHALLLQVRRDTVGSNRIPFLQDRTGSDIAAADVDQLASSLQDTISHVLLYLARGESHPVTVQAELYKTNPFMVDTYVPHLVYNNADDLAD